MSSGISQTTDGIEGIGRGRVAYGGRFVAVGPERNYSPEQELCWAVLLDAVEIVTGRRLRYRAQALRAETLAWISDPGDRPFSYVWCAQHLHLEDPERLRRYLLEPSGERAVVHLQHKATRRLGV